MSKSRLQGPRRRNVHIAVLAATAALTGFHSTARATDYTWDAAGGAGDWADPNSWTADSGVPIAGDNTLWQVGTSADPSSVTLSANAFADTITVDRVTTTFNLNNFALTTTGQNDFNGNTGHAIFNGPGTMNSNGTIRIGFLGFDGVSQVTAQGGATVNSSGLLIGDYFNSGRINITGNGTVWNSSGPVTFARGGNADQNAPYQDPRAEIRITDGAVFNHTLASGGAGPQNQWTMAPAGVNKHSKITVDGPGSQFNFLGTYTGNMRIGGYGSNVSFEVTNGGLWSAPDLGMTLGFYSGAGVAHVTISGGGAKMTANTWALSGRNTSDIGRNASVVRVGLGGTLEATGFDGNDRAIAVGDKGILSIEGGTVSLPTDKTLNLRNGPLADKATLRGFGSITGGSLVAEQDSVIAPGLGTGTGTIVLTDGNLTTATGGTGVDLKWHLQTSSSGNNVYDRVVLASPTSSVTIGDNATDDITFIVEGQEDPLLGSLAAGGRGFVDFLIAGTINYGGTTLGTNVANVDNLDDLMDAAGYTRTSFIPAEGEYRYYLTFVGPTDYEGGAYTGQQALRLEMTAVPEPGSLAMLAFGVGPLLRRRRRRS